jgi:Flp pilus assembly pilin Flp
MMKAQVITTEYADQWPLQPWAAVVQTAAPDADDAEKGLVPATCHMSAAPSGRIRDRGASAVEWVIITGIAVVIVVAVGGIISTALTTKANTTKDQITNATIGP